MEEKNEAGPVVDNTVEKIKVKKPKMKKFDNPDNGVFKVDLAKPSETVEQDIIKVDLTKPVDEVKQEQIVEETAVLEEVIKEVNTETEAIVAEVEAVIEESIQTGKPLPENIQKLVEFMENTGGDLNDYVKLNQDYSKLDDQDLLSEYYKQTKPHLSNEEISFLMEDQFSYEEDVDDDREIKRKKLALKEQVANAKSHLDGQKSKYYDEIKAGSKLSKEQQKAIDFFNRYNKESEEINKSTELSRNDFLKKTNQVFNDEFKGFEYNVGEKNYRFNIKDVNGVKDNQVDINKFMTKFVDEQSKLIDPTGYHKSLYTAMNADAVAKHFYEQGKADAIKDSVAKAKNVDMNPRQTHGEIETGGMKFRVLSDDNSPDFKFKIKNNKFKN
jgi:hypothetical protein